MKTSFYVDKEEFVKYILACVHYSGALPGSQRLIKWTGHHPLSQFGGWTSSALRSPAAPLSALHLHAVNMIVSAESEHLPPGLRSKGLCRQLAGPVSASSIPSQLHWTRPSGTALIYLLALRCKVDEMNQFLPCSIPARPNPSGNVLIDQLTTLPKV